MKVKWIRYGGAIALMAATLIAADQGARLASIQAAQQFYAEQQYVSDRDIQFSPSGLQGYSAEMVSRSTDAGRLTQGLITIVGFGITFAVLLSPDKTTWKRQFESWKKAVERGDNSAIAQIELEIQNERGNL